MLSSQINPKRLVLADLNSVAAPEVKIVRRSKQVRPIVPKEESGQQALEGGNSPIAPFVIR
jgi:hypothetical protein